MRPGVSSAKPPKPWGRIAGRAVALAGEQARGERRERLGSVPSSRIASAHHAAAEATGGARGAEAVAARARRGEHGAAEILLEPVGDIGPQRRRPRRPSGRWDRPPSPCGRRSSTAAKSVRWWIVIGATVPCCDSATAASEVILALGVAALTTKISGLPARSHRSTVAPTARRSCGLGPGRDDDQLGDRDHALDRHGDRRRRIDHRQLEALLAQHLEIVGEPRDGGLRERRKFALALVPPVGQRALRIDIDQHDRAGAGPLGLHREMTGQRGLARPALLRCHRQNAHLYP